MQADHVRIVAALEDRAKQAETEAATLAAQKGRNDAAPRTVDCARSPALRAERDGLLAAARASVARPTSLDTTDFVDVPLAARPRRVDNRR
jgi:hypothetical protein